MFENILALDFEIVPNGEVYHIGAVLNDKAFQRNGIKAVKPALEELSAFSGDAGYILGHNIARHDLPAAEKQVPGAGFLSLPVIDTLFLSPLAFPENPYHKLIKDYKLVKTARNDPVADARLALAVFDDQVAALSALHRRNPGLAAFYAFAFHPWTAAGQGEFSLKGNFDLFARLAGKVPEAEEAKALFLDLAGDKVCPNGIESVWDLCLADRGKRPALAYLLAWIMVSGGNSVIPPWVRLGDIGILYISPEQLRNAGVSRLIQTRKVGCWVFDEAHCLSKWGHDFRPDYLYVSRFIAQCSRNAWQKPLVGAFTATAKKDVMDEVVSHCRERLSIDLDTFEGGVQRDNLSFQVWPVTGNEKQDVIANCLKETLDAGPGGAIVYCSSRKHTEELSLFLNQRGIASHSFHAGKSEPDKRNIQDDFVAGKIPVICATNAFGMGIDKKDIRLVIHADIPGSLENYLQEAGRAGRDMEPSECILLYEEEDIENQFALNAYSRLSIKEIKKILAILKKRGAKTPEIVISPGEIMRLMGEKRSGADDAKARIGVSWLERKGFLEQSYNQTLFFKGTPVVKSMAEASQTMDRLGLSKISRAIYATILSFLFNADANTVVSADDICAELGKLPNLPPHFLDPRQVITLQNGLGVFRQAMTITMAPQSAKRQYTRGDYQPLSHHYDQKNVQVHVMERFARLGLEKIKTALHFVSDYFSSSHDRFIRRHFPGEEEIIQTAMTAEAYKKIVQSLENSIQESIVAADTAENLLVLAGPGSGKTKTIVHRCAWLIRAKSVDPAAILSGEKTLAGTDPAEAREHHLAGFRYVLVDEYQDIDQQQYDFISALTGRLASDAETKIAIMAVGDDDQSIYGFRRASVAFNHIGVGPGQPPGIQGKTP